MPDSEILRQVEAEFAPPDDPVFHLVPPAFDAHAKDAWQLIGAPDEVNVDNFWEIFRAMSDVFREASETLPRFVPYTYEEPPQGTLQLLQGYKEMVAPLPLNLREGIAESAGNNLVGRAAVGTAETWWRHNNDDEDDGENDDEDDDEDDDAGREVRDNRSSGREDSEYDSDGSEGAVGDIQSLLRLSKEELARRELFGRFMDLTDSEDESEEEDGE